jgi:hypothetical protein
MSLEDTEWQERKVNPIAYEDCRRASLPAGTKLHIRRYRFSPHTAQMMWIFASPTTGDDGVAATECQDATAVGTWVLLPRVPDSLGAGGVQS